jgi:cysteine-rich repeat protein
MTCFRRLSKFMVPFALLALGSACADEGDGLTGGSGAGGSEQGGEAPEGGAGGTGGDATGGTSEGGTSEGGAPQGGAPMGGAAQGGGGMGEGGGGGGPVLNPDEFPPETEPNGTLAQANELPDGALGFQAELSDLNDIDIYSVYVPLGSTFRAEITDGMGGCPPGADVALQIYNPANFEIASTSGLCPRLDGTNDPDLTTIAEEGTYFVRVTTSALVPFYAIEIDVSPPVCGDGVPQLGEECDDGNLIDGDGCQADCTETPNCGDGSVQLGEECDDGDLMSGDGCDSACQLEGAYCPEGEPNNTLGSATLITSCDGGYGEINPGTDLDYYEFSVTDAGSSVRIEVVDIAGTGCPTGFDSQLRLYNSGNTQLGSDDDDGNVDCSLINPVTDTWATNLPPGDYFVLVEELGNNAVSPPYVVLIDVLAPGCGDGVFQSANGEECDDGNLVDGDGCSNLCEVEGNYCAEVESNDSLATANSLDVAGCEDGAAGQISAIGDADYFSVTVTAGSSIRVQTTNITGTGCPAGTDTVIRLYSPSDVELGSNDQGGFPSCSLIDPSINPYAANLPAGTYKIRVEDWLNNGTTGAWLLKVDVNPPGCGDGIAQAGEQCDDGNLVNGDGCDEFCGARGQLLRRDRAERHLQPGHADHRLRRRRGPDQLRRRLRLVLVHRRERRLERPHRGDRRGRHRLPHRLRLVRPPVQQQHDAARHRQRRRLRQLLADQPRRRLLRGQPPAGTYYVRVEENGNDTVSQPYVVHIDVNAPGCGDGILQAGELCDDGNAITFRHRRHPRRRQPAPMTPELALRLGRAITYVASRGKRRTPARAHRQGHAPLGLHDRDRARRRHLRDGWARHALRPIPTPAVAQLTRACAPTRASSSARATTPTGQRHQDLRRRRLQAPRRRPSSRSRRSSTTAACSAPPHRPRRRPRESRIDDARGRYVVFAKATFPRETHARRRARRRRRGPRRGLQGRARSSSRSSAPTVTALGVKPNGRNINAERAARCTPSNVRARSSRRRRPSASRSTATPIASSWSTRRARSSTATRSWRCAPRGCSRARHAQEEHARRHGDEQPRARAGDANEAAASSCAPRSAIATSSRRCARVATTSAASSRGTSSSSTTPRPATASSRRCRSPR